MVIVKIIYTKVTAPGVLTQRFMRKLVNLKVRFTMYDIDTKVYAPNTWEWKIERLEN